MCFKARLECGLLRGGGSAGRGEMLPQRSRDSGRNRGKRAQICRLPTSAAICTSIPRRRGQSLAYRISQALVPAGSDIYLGVFTGGAVPGMGADPGSPLLPLAAGIGDFRGSLLAFAFLKLLLMFLLTTGTGLGAPCCCWMGADLE